MTGCNGYHEINHDIVFALVIAQNSTNGVFGDKSSRNRMIPKTEWGFPWSIVRLLFRIHISNSISSKSFNEQFADGKLYHSMGWN